jgi:hypothetical protein
MSDCSCDYNTRAGTTYNLEVEREGDVSDHSCNSKMRVGTTYRLEIARLTCQIAVVTTNEGRVDLQARGGEGG